MMDLKICGESAVGVWSRMLFHSVNCTADGDGKKPLLCHCEFLFWNMGQELWLMALDFASVRPPTVLYSMVTLLDVCPSCRGSKWIVFNYGCYIGGRAEVTAVSKLVSKHGAWCTVLILWWWWSRASCPRMSVVTLGTNCDQCRSMVQCCFTSTETVRLIRMESPGRPPQLSHSPWTLALQKLCFSRFIVTGRSN